MKKEVKYALEALSGRLPREDKNLDWFYLLGFLELNRVAGAFLTTAEGLEMKLPPSVHRCLSAVRAEQADRGHRLRAGRFRDGIRLSEGQHSLAHAVCGETGLRVGRARLQRRGSSDPPEGRGQSFPRAGAYRLPAGELG